MRQKEIELAKTGIGLAFMKNPKMGRLSMIH